MPDPSVTASLRNLRFNDRPFSSAMWDEESRAMLVVNEFSKMSWADLHLDPYPTAATVDAEITDLFSRMSERAELLPEILDQMTTLVPSFTAALGISRVSHPATHLVITTCEKISAFVAPYFKSTALRPRPSQIAPALHPPVPLPGTPSYPQQHGLSAYLIANSLGNLLPAAAAKPLTELAFNFADNRVVAGLSYPSDVAAAKEIAGAVFPLLQACASFNAVMQRAKMEWGGVTATELPDTQATAITTATQFDLDSTLRRFEAAGERMLLVFEPVPDRTLTAADLAVGLQFLSDLQRHATAIVSAASVLASQPALSAREAYDQALGGPLTDALSELELLDMGTGTPAWIEALVKNKATRAVAFGLGLAMMPMAGQTTADILVPPVSDYMCRQQVWDGVTKILPQPQITESNKKMLMQLAFDHMEKSCKALEDHKLVPKVMPADALAKGSLQHYGRNQQPRAATQPRRARR